MKKTPLIALLLTAALASSASANSVRAKYLGVSGPNRRIVSFPNVGPSGHYYSGLSTFDRVDGHADNVGLGLELPDRFIGYCVDIEESIQNGWTRTWSIEDLGSAPNAGSNAMGATKADMLSWLWDHVDPETATAHGAIQAAIWEIVNEDIASNGLNIQSGQFGVNGLYGSDVSLINAWFAAMPGDADLAGLAEDNGHFAMVNNGTQDFMISIPVQPTFQPVPEPLTMISLFGATGSLGVYLRRRRA
jgi:hypothetical protein